jgi:hypothetical protein
MRRWLALCALAFAIGGCGVLDDEGPAVPKAPDPAVYGPAKATKTAVPSIPVPKLAEPTAAVARALDGGSIGVVDLSGDVSIEPGSLDTAADLTLADVHWSSWGDGGAAGTGRLRMLTCQPTCAGSGTKDVPARIALSGVKTCDGRRYFEHGEVLIAPRDAPSDGAGQPTTYLRAPC